MNLKAQTLSKNPRFEKNPGPKNMAFCRFIPSHEKKSPKVIPESNPRKKSSKVKNPGSRRFRENPGIKIPK